MLAFRFYKWEEVQINWEDLDMLWEEVGILEELLSTGAILPSSSEEKKFTFDVEKINQLPAEKKLAVIALAIAVERKDIKNKLIKDLFLNLKKQIGVFNDFFKKPASLISLTAISLAIINEFLPQILNNIKGEIPFLSGKDFSDISDPYNPSEDDVQQYVKNNSVLQKALDYIGKDLDDSIISEIAINCQNLDDFKLPSATLSLAIPKRSLTGKDYIKILDKNSDFDYKTENKRVTRELSTVLSQIETGISWSFLVFYIAIKTKEFLTQNDYPSSYRGKYLQRVIRTFSAILKISISNEAQAIRSVPSTLVISGKKRIEQTKALLNILKSFDTIIGASLLASAIYLINRKDLQKKSQETFEGVFSIKTCETITPALSELEASTQFDPNKLNVPVSLIECPVNDDQDIAVHIPIEEKLNTLSCEDTTVNRDVNIEEKLVSDLATNAIIENKSDSPFKILVSKGSQLTPLKTLAIWDKKKIVSPISGIVQKIEPNKIYIGNISDPVSSPMESLIEEVQNNYLKINNTKSFIKDFYIETMYPSMLKNSPLIDGSINSLELQRIIYPFGGVKERWNGVLSAKNSQKATYENNCKNISSPENVKIKAEAERLDIIQKDIEAEEKTLFNSIKSDYTRGINQSKVTLPDKEEFHLIEYYLGLLENLSLIKNKNDIQKQFLTIIQGIVRRRYFIDGYDLDKIKAKINKYCETLSSGTYFRSKPDFYNIIKGKYQKTLPRSGQKSVAIKSYLDQLGSNNKDFTSDAKDEIKSYIIFLFNFSLVSKDIKTKVSVGNSSPYSETISESVDIENFFKKLWKDYSSIPQKITSNFSQIGELSDLLSSYSVIKEEGKEYRYYGISDPINCAEPDEIDPNFLPSTKYGFGDQKYWLKYCSLATLASVANPISGWSTGLILPTGPLLLPVVYIPIRAIQLKWGFIVIGLTVTGIYPFPWVLYVNYSTENHAPLGDPTGPLKAELAALKKEISDQMSKLREGIIKGYLDGLKKEIDGLENIISDLKEQKRLNNTNKPRRNRDLEEKTSLALYSQQILNWETNRVSIEEQIVTAKTQKWKKEAVYKILKSVFDGRKAEKNSDPKVVVAEKSQDAIDKSVSKLDTLSEKINSTLSGLPTNTYPETSNFGGTAKNPKPIVNMASNLDDTVNNTVIEKFVEGKELKSEDLAGGQFSNKLGSSVNNIEGDKGELSALMTSAIKADPFPRYEKLKPTNLLLMSFLLKSWTPTGAACFGIPGNPPFPA